MAALFGVDGPTATSSMAVWPKPRRLGLLCRSRPHTKKAHMWRRSSRLGTPLLFSRPPVLEPM